MADPKAFLTIGRAKTPKRPVDERVGDYLHIYESFSPEEVRTQASRCMDCGVPFCNSGCPLGNLIPEWNDLIYKNQWRDAIDRLHLTNNFPEFTGMLCPAPCEDACVLTINDQPVTIKESERSIIEKAFSEGWVTAQPPILRTDFKVAVIGSGPAGLAAAQQLNKAGHSVTVFEKDDRIGGLLRYGIPDFKIEKWMIDRRLQLLEEEGIEFRTSVNVGTSPTLAELREEYDSVLLAVGALAGRDLPIEGRELNGIHLAMDYLVQQNRRVAKLPVTAETITATDKRVVIIGGGDTGADCLGNVNRENCASVSVITRGEQPPEKAAQSEWPDVPMILRTWAAHEEGGEREFEVKLHKFSGENGHVQKVHVSRNGIEDIIEADLVLLAVGFTGPVHDDLITQLAPEFSDSGAINCDGQHRTNTTGIFATGDAVKGASLIVTAIADGRKAASSINAWLKSRG